MVSLCPALTAARQQSTDLPVSLEHIRVGLEKPQGGVLAFPPPVPLPVFRTKVEEKDPRRDK
jgi:hypothetical protein